MYVCMLNTFIIIIGITLCTSVSKSLSLITSSAYIIHCCFKARYVENRHAKTAAHVLRLEGRELANVLGVFQETVVNKVSRICLSTKVSGQFF